MENVASIIDRQNDAGVIPGARPEFVTWRDAYGIFVTKETLRLSLESIQSSIKDIVSRKELEVRWRSEDERRTMEDDLRKADNINIREMKTNFESNVGSLDTKLDSFIQEQRAAAEIAQSNKLPKWAGPAIYAMATIILGSVGLYIQYLQIHAH